MKPEKKFFSYQGIDYTIVKGKRWYAEYYTLKPTGKPLRNRIYGPNRTKDLGLRELQYIELIRARHANPNVKKSNSALLDKLEEFKRLWRQKTYESYKSVVKYYVAWLKKSDLLATKQDAEAFINHLHAKGLSNRRLRAYKDTLRGIYNRLGLSVNPFVGIEIRKEQSTSLMYFNDEQIDRITCHLKVHDKKVYIAIQLLFYCFIRPGEMRNLRISDINTQDGYIELRGEISKNKKNQKVSIPEQLRVQLEQYIAGHEKYKYLFTATQMPGLKMAGRDHISKRHKKALDKLEIAGNFGLYSWKHTGVVKAVQSGINLKDIQLQLRHHSLDMVNEYLKNLGVMDSKALRFSFPTL